MTRPQTGPASGPASCPHRCFKGLITIAVFWKSIVSAQISGPGCLGSPCQETPNTNVNVPGSGCVNFYVCREGIAINRLACKEGLLFDVNIGACNFEYLVFCVDPTCSPTLSPSESPTDSPTKSPSVSPTVSPTKSPTTSPTESPTEFPSFSPTASPSISPKLATNVIISKKSLIEQNVLKSYTASGQPYPSITYTFGGFLDALQKMKNEDLDADLNFKLWDEHKTKYRLGLINVAAFLANAMVESIYDDTCDELNWQQVAGKYAISNACGQEGRSYQDETCGIYSCIMDPSMEITAVDAANDVRAPPPMECRPGSGLEFFSGYWDTRTGTEVKRTPYANTAGRTDVEGCCYWGRGALITRGSCNIGKLNYYLGARAAREGRRSLYPGIDFCVDPEATCSNSDTGELRWTTALFEWSDNVQNYNNDEWAYEEELQKFFDGGLVDDSFIDSVGRILSRGCHAPGCSDLEVRFADDRKANFNMIINDILEIDRLEAKTSTPTQRPAIGPTAPIATARPIAPPSLSMPTEPITSPFNTPNLFTTPGPTPQPFPGLTNPPVKSVTLPPQPILPSPSFPTTTIGQPPSLPIINTDTPEKPSNIGSPGQSINTGMPTETGTTFPADMIIPIEDNGAARSCLVMGVHACVHVISVGLLYHLLLCIVLL